MKEIKIQELENIKIGSAENKDAATGCTVILCEQGMAAGLDVRGGGPASRETELLKPTAAAESIHAVLLSGGSAFGLDAAGGVMEYLEERNIGFNVGITKVPLVCESCLFDLMVGDHRVRRTRLWAMRPVRMRKRAITGTGISVSGPEPLWESFTDRSSV